MSETVANEMKVRFPGLLGMRIVDVHPGYCRMEIDVEERPFVHAAFVCSPFGDPKKRNTAPSLTRKSSEK